MPPKDVLEDPSPVHRLAHNFNNRVQRLKDASVPHKAMRWFFFAVLSLLYLARVVSFGGFHVISYALFVHLLYYALLVITPESEAEMEEAALPSRRRGRSTDPDDFRPFVPKEQEFQVWWRMIRVLGVCLVLVMFPFLDVPVYWPILVLYSIGLLASQMGGRVKHMLKYKYVPWNTGKPKFVTKDRA